MSKIDKLIRRLLSRPKDFKYEELVKILKHFGYEEVKKGKTAGSRRAFIHKTTNHIIRLHKPHPGNILKMYIIDYMIEELENQGLI
jgi:predicted RNA binding protein YcfA (HicA-like mRNA interferase family)